MGSNTANSKRIAKNTMMLYLRMMLLMVVSLYTSRVNLNALGVIDYGLYGVVGGVVSMFWLVSTALVGSINRFLTFELGTGNQERLNRVFSTAKGIQYLIVAVVFILAETVGLWFLNHKMVIPADRIVAANWVYQLSVVSFCMDLVVIPYTAAIIAHEKMSAFAYISILTAVGKLVVAWTTLIVPMDRLVWFAAMILLNATVIRTIYIVYCKRHFEECRAAFKFDRAIWSEMFGFAGWNFIGTIAATLRDYGGNILINLFAGPAVNAARTIAQQVNGAVGGFVDNFQTALKPQITKNYACGNFEYMFTLVFQGARLSYYILFIFVLPILCNTHYILYLWLGQVPEHSPLFVQLILIYTLNESLSGTLITAMLATGHIRNFQIIVGGLNLLNLPLSYIALRMGAIPESVVVVAILLSIMCIAARVLLLRGMIGLSVRAFISKVYLNVIGVSIISALLPLYISHRLSESFLHFVIVSVVALACTLLSILFVGCSRSERGIVYSKGKAIATRLLVMLRRN